MTPTTIKQVFKSVCSYPHGMNHPLRSFLARLYDVAVEAALPRSFLPPLLPAPPAGRIILLAAGKAAGSMAEAAEAFYLNDLKLDPDRALSH